MDRMFFLPRSSWALPRHPLCTHDEPEPCEGPFLSFALVKVNNKGFVVLMLALASVRLDECLLMGLQRIPKVAARPEARSSRTLRKHSTRSRKRLTSPRAVDVPFSGSQPVRGPVVI
jgi:hypothetical protein